MEKPKQKLILANSLLILSVLCLPAQGEGEEPKQADSKVSQANKAHLENLFPEELFEGIPNAFRNVAQDGLTNSVPAAKIKERTMFIVELTPSLTQKAMNAKQEGDPDQALAYLHVGGLSASAGASLHKLIGVENVLEIEKQSSRLPALAIVAGKSYAESVLMLRGAAVGSNQSGTPEGKELATKLLTIIEEILVPRLAELEKLAAP